MGLEGEPDGVRPRPRRDVPPTPHPSEEKCPELNRILRRAGRRGGGRTRVCLPGGATPWIPTRASAHAGRALAVLPLDDPAVVKQWSGEDSNLRCFWCDGFTARWLRLLPTPLRSDTARRGFHPLARGPGWRELHPLALRVPVEGLAPTLCLRSERSATAFAPHGGCGLERPDREGPSTSPTVSSRAVPRGVRTRPPRAIAVGGTPLLAGLRSSQCPRSPRRAWNATLRRDSGSKALCCRAAHTL